MYQLTFEELKIHNFHITDFNHLNPGMKLKIPFLTEEVNQILDKSESFVGDYYPTMEMFGLKEPKKEKEVVNNAEIVDNHIEVKKSEEVTTPKVEERLRYPGANPPKTIYKGNVKPKII